MLTHWNCGVAVKTTNMFAIPCRELWQPVRGGSIGIRGTAAFAANWLFDVRDRLNDQRRRSQGGGGGSGRRHHRVSGAAFGDQCSFLHSCVFFTSRPSFLPLWHSLLLSGRSIMRMPRSNWRTPGMTIPEIFGRPMASRISLTAKASGYRALLDNGPVVLRPEVAAPSCAGDPHRFRLTRLSRGGPSLAQGGCSKSS